MFLLVCVSMRNVLYMGVEKNYLWLMSLYELLLV